MEAALQIWVAMKNVCARDSLEDSCIAFYQVSTEDKGSTEDEAKQKKQGDKKNNHRPYHGFFSCLQFTHVYVFCTFLSGLFHCNRI